MGAAAGVVRAVADTHRDVFGATNCDLVHYVSYRDRLGLITANATTPYILNFIDLAETGSAGDRAAARAHRRRRLRLLATRDRRARRDGPGRGRGGKHLVVPPGTPTPEVDDCYSCTRRPG